MKAIRVHEYGGPEVLRLEEVEDPVITTNDGVLVSLYASGVNPAEVSRRAGKGNPIEFPAILGIEGAGEVIGIGEDVKSIKIGDRVIVRQPAYSYAELVVAPEGSIYKFPSNISYAEASTIAIIYTTAWAALHVKGEAKPGDTILVQAAASGVGIAAVQLAKHLGMTVIGTSSTDEKLDWAKDFGLDHGINYTEVDFVEQTKKITDGRGVDVIVDGVGGEVLTKGISTLARNGRLCIFGGANSRESTFSIPSLFRIGGSIRGCGGAETSPEDFTKILTWFEQGFILPTIDKTWPLADAIEAHKYQESRQIKGKSALLIRGN
ncbi:MAG: hypothetical protein CL763_01680 [Chloroflexi bacterium]|nr:hypothetical protein [Chloroflexota bacterium]MQF86631.1 zinc-binding alcohol dehydrogenase family protein [SAR202 cluster bacterium]|tara:strand:- start:555 stop:1517 length:963 start_codon:yes stop_codon:yes gene_type:complete